MRRNMVNLLTFALLGASGLASGMSFNPNCNSCCTSCFGGGDFVLWADALFFQPSSCNFDYAISDCVKGTKTHIPNGKEHGVRPKYHWGYRVGGNYYFPCSELDAGVYYSHLNCTDRMRTRVVGTDILWPTTTASRFTPEYIFSDDHSACAYAEVKHRWNSVDGEVGYTLKEECRYSIRGHIGLHWTDIAIIDKVGYKGKFHQKHRLSDRYSGEYCSDVKTWGIGPRFGFDFNYLLGYGIGFASHTGFGLLAGETRQNFEGVNFDEKRRRVLSNGFHSSFGVCSRRRNIVFPEFDTTLGLNYSLNLCRRYECLFEVGWEFRTYLQAIVHRTYRVGYTTDPFSLQGLYISGLVKF